MNTVDYIFICFNVFGELLRDSGWIDALSEDDGAYSGTSKSFLSSSNTPTTKLAHQTLQSHLHCLIY